MSADGLEDTSVLVVISKYATLKELESDSMAGVCRVGSTISSLIGAAETGDSAAADTLFSTLYSELHRLAKRELARRGSPASLSVTTLLHEAYLDIAKRDGPSFPDRARFMGYAARVMRGLIIDHARSRNAVKRGGENVVVVRAQDTTDPSLPTGKQVGWYTPSSGIWQTVWLEARPRTYIADFRIVTKLGPASVHVKADIAGLDQKSTSLV